MKISGNIPTLALMVASMILMASGADAGLGPRGKADWKLLAGLHEDIWSGDIMIKIEDGADPALVGHRIVDGAGTTILDLDEVLPTGSIVSMDQGFGLDLQMLDGLVDNARARCGCDVAEMSAWFRVRTVPWMIDLKPALASLNEPQLVEVAYPVADRLRIPPPVDIPPTTPLWTFNQGYRNAAPDGIDAIYANTIPGGRGENVPVVDIEVGWDFDHEDLETCVAGFITGIGSLPPDMDVDYMNHGTAVLGELFGGDNGYGMTGIVPDGICHAAPDWTQEWGFSIARAISWIIHIWDEGPGVILLEVHIPGPHYDPDDGSQDGLVPAEWDPASYDGIRLAVTSGIAVVEAAGNGQEDLDDTGAYGDAFDRSVRDSGAIMVGGGTPATESPAREPEWYTNYGARVDVQGWGSEVYTAGYGDLFDGGGDIHQLYTDTFGGTSSASPIVTGAVAAVTGATFAHDGDYIDPEDLRDLLTVTGTAQAPSSRHIGPLPDLYRALGAAVPICGDDILNDREACEDGNTVDGDGCSADCMSDETCGNGITDAVTSEICDDGNTADGDGCSADCMSDETCGNTIVDTAASEICDDGNNDDGDGCSADCLSDETCGNATLDDVASEICDDGNTTGGDGCSADCMSDETCGNTIVDTAAGEVCDDGNDEPGDGCSFECLSDESCANGFLDEEAGEICDDGNTNDGDGCSADCLSDETCGNGILDEEAGEQCDDGNLDPGDMCSELCEIETTVAGGCGCRIAASTTPLPAILIFLVLVLAAALRGKRHRLGPF